MKQTLFEHIQDARKDILQGRIVGLQLAIITATNDPLQLNRVQVTTADKGGLSGSDWCFMTSIGKGVTMPQPVVGDTVIVGYFDGDAHKPVCIGILHNMVNPPIPDTYDISLSENQTASIHVGNSWLVLTKDAITLSQGSTTLRIMGNSATLNGKEIATVNASVSSGKVVSRGW